ncbi:MAG: hypothetical protein NDI75_15325 [Candidatus Didemnitutus sp.]|nr:hypothetical protein [Candidatus Didemnitutus sp.]
MDEPLVLGQEDADRIWEAAALKAALNFSALHAHARAHFGRGFFESRAQTQKAISGPAKAAKTSVVIADKGDIW